ncbi:UNVERIFIED_CONTAM: hypothetical protein PYX00_005704 [Menopon gallinae]|uniref:Uncharacterized protein n=1 Tax=Menopon gallinae TaxID=328185 RepID=A0AAW2HU74_9NEOP
MCDEEEVEPPPPTMTTTTGEECVCVPKEEVVVKKEEVKLGACRNTCPFDPRFPHQNQTRRCVVNFIDYQRCVRLLGPYQGCRIFKACYEALCPSDWISKWSQQLEDGTFPWCIYPPKPDDMQYPDESVPFDATGY